MAGRSQIFVLASCHLKSGISLWHWATWATRVIEKLDCRWTHQHFSIWTRVSDGGKPFQLVTYVGSGYNQQATSNQPMTLLVWGKGVHIIGRSIWLLIGWSCAAVVLSIAPTQWTRTTTSASTPLLQSSDDFSCLPGRAMGCYCSSHRACHGSSQGLDPTDPNRP